MGHNVYIPVGSEEGDEYIPPLNAFVDLLKKRNYKGLVMKYDVIERHEHNTVFKPSIRNKLRMLYGTERK